MALSETLQIALIGFAGGLVLGLAARRGRFCTLGALEDALYGQDWRRVRMWALALGLSIPATLWLSDAGHVDLDASIYGAVVWNPMASVAGGLLFGYGMALAGNCGFGALARAGGGDIRSIVIVLVMGISAYMAIGGPTGAVRVWLFPPEAAGDGDFGYAHWIGRLTGVGTMGVGLIAGLGAMLWALWAADFRRSAGQMFWSLAVAAAIVSGWWGSSWIAAHAFEDLRPVSHTFTAPLGESILYLMTATGGGLSFAIGSVAGVLVGALIGALSLGQFRWEACDDPRELGRQMLGAFLMGTGGVIALGCSVGQGLTAMSALWWGAPVTLAAICVGAAIGLRQLIEGFRPV